MGGDVLRLEGRNEITPELIEKASTVDIAHRAQKALERAASQGEAEAVFLEFQRKQAAENAPTEIGRRKVALFMLGAIAIVGGVAVLSNYGPTLRQKWNYWAATQRLASAKQRLTLSSAADQAPGPAADEDPLGD